MSAIPHARTPKMALLVDPEVERAEDLLEAIAVDLDKMLTDAEEDDQTAGLHGSRA